MRAVFYHGVADRRDTRGYLGSLFADVHDFEEQVSTIARQWRPISLAEVHEHLVERRPLSDRAVHVSIDDGFRTTLPAAEILDRHRVPWTLFVVSEAVLAGYEPWYVRLANAVSASTSVRGRDGTVHDLSDAAGEYRFLHLVKAELMAAPARATEDVLRTVFELPGMRSPEENPYPFLTVDELRELHSAGVEIGNHSARHVNLNRCRPDELDDEVDASRARLEAALGAPVRFFSYPDGRHCRRVRARVGRGHDLAMATWTPRPSLSPLAMRRLLGPGTGADMTAVLGTWAPFHGARTAARWELPEKARDKLYRFFPATRTLSKVP